MRPRAHFRLLNTYKKHFKTLRFLDASSHLYKRVCPSVRWSVRPSVRPLVRPLVRNAFVKIAENGVIQDGDASYVVYTALLVVHATL